jgi:diguanylate cyclase (GGDEF)-like protein
VVSSSFHGIAMFKSRFVSHALIVRLFLAAFCAIVIALVVSNGRSAVRKIDDASLRRDEGIIRNGMFLARETVVAEMLGMANWDEAVQKLFFEPDTEWMKEYLGSGVKSDNDVQMFLVSRDRKVIFRGKTDSYGAVSLESAGIAAIEPMLARLDAQYAMVYPREDLKQGYEYQRLSDIEGIFDSIYAHRLMRLFGKPSIVIAAAVIPDVDFTLIGDKLPGYMVQVMPLDAGATGRLMDVAQLSDVELGEPGPAEDGRGRLVVEDRAGNPIAMATWAIDPPGSALIRDMAPGLALSILLMILAGIAAERAITRINTRLAQREAAARHAAAHDSMTGLANRETFNSALAEASATLKGDRLAGVLLIDLDHFKSINDTLGHPAGDAVILAAAARMRAMGEDVAAAARLGGDEFAVLTRQFKDRDALSAFCARLHEALSASVPFDGKSIAIGCSIGASALTERGVTGKELLAKADLALYRAKRDGRACFRIHDPALDTGEADIEALKAMVSRGATKAAPAKAA